MPDDRRHIDDIRAQMAANRVSVGVSAANLRESLSPKNIAKSGIEETKEFLKGEYTSAKAQFVEADGSVNLQRVLVIGGAVLGAIVFFATLNSIGHRRQLGKARKLLLEAAGQ
ncbi:MAG TPA: hypothetical protein PKE40_01340 [Arachnia sp.]|nr:hypothetical protein [Arachnia sp.]HMT84972.1 hypothetical protein [Arachnia sp.]